MNNLVTNDVKLLSDKKNQIDDDADADVEVSPPWALHCSILIN